VLRGNFVEIVYCRNNCNDGLLIIQGLFKTRK
jgi:hypothetical protein